MPDPDQSVALADTVASGEKRPLALARGTAIGRYLVLDVLGEGGMGTVYSAYDPELDRKVAIKLLKLEGEEARTRLLREAQAMARLSDPNVVPVYDAGPWRDRLYVAMELVEGQTLRRWLDEKPRSRREILRSFRAAGAGLAAAHAAGLVHRDFKPENVLVGKGGRICVSDFGLARLDSREPAADTGEILGTPAYMAPEQFAGLPTDPRTDQFSFCLSLWEALCGERPFEGEGVEGLRTGVLKGALRALPKNASMPRWLRRSLSRGLSRRPADRFPDLETLLVELERRRQALLWRAAGWAAALLVILGCAFWVAWRGHRERTRCTREADEAAQAIWSDSRRLAVGRTLRTLERGEPAVQATIAEIDGEMAELKGAQVAVCESGRKGALGERAERRAMGCLSDYGVRAEAALGLLSTPSADLGESLEALLEGLRGPAVCLAPAAEPASRAGHDVSRLRAGAEEAKLLMDLGRSGPAVQKLTGLLAEARAAGDRALAADLGLSLGLALPKVEGPTERGLAVLREAMRDADAAGQDELSLRTRIALFDHLNDQLLRPAAAEEVAKDAEAWLKRLGSPPHLELSWAQAQASLQMRLGRGDESLALFKRVLELTEKVNGPRSPRVAKAHNDLSATYAAGGRYSESARELETALRLYDQARWRPIQHVALGWTNLAFARLYSGRSAEALVAAERGTPLFESLQGGAAPYLAWNASARALSLEQLGRLDEAAQWFDRALARPELLDAPDRAEALAARARLHVAKGETDQALAAAREALKLAEAPGVEPTALGDARFAMAQALWLQGADRGAALAMARQALETYRGPEDQYLRDRVRRWLADKGVLPAGTPGR